MWKDFPLRDDFVDTALRQEIVVRLVDVGYLYCLAHFERSVVGLFLSHDKAEEGSLAGAVSPG